MSAPAAVAKAGNQPVQVSADSFIANTRPKDLIVCNNRGYIDGGSDPINLQPTGLGYSLLIKFKFVIAVTGTVSSGTLQGWPYPAPLSLIKRIRLSNNNSTYLRDLSGAGMYTWLRERTLMDPNQSNTGALYSTLTNADVGNGQSWPVPGAAVPTGAGGTTYNFTICWEMPLAYNKMGDKGLLVMQSNAQTYVLQVDYGQVVGGISATGGTNDFFNALVGTGLGVTCTASVSIQQKYFDIVLGLDISNLLSQYVAVSEQIFNPSNGGLNTIQIPVSGTYTMVMFQHVNNGALVDPANIQNPQISHNGAIIDFIDSDATMRAIENLYLHKRPPMDGTVVYDLGLRRGIPDRRDVMDGIVSTAITNFLYQWTYPSGLSLTNAQCRMITESLLAGKQSIPNM